MNDLEVARRVVEGFFVRKGQSSTVPAQTKQEFEERLFVAHSLVNSVLMGNAGKNGLAEKWEPQLEEIEDRINKLRNQIAAQPL